MLDRVQRIGGQAVIGCSRTVGTAMEETKANLPTIKVRRLRKALRVWDGLYSVPDTHPLARLIRRRTYGGSLAKRIKTAETPDIGKRQLAAAVGISGD